MKKTKIQAVKKAKNEHILFLDLSIDLDRDLSFLGYLTENSNMEELPSEEMLPEVGYYIFEYLGKRVALEHVFFGRSLRRVRFDPSKLKAEVWRIQKIKAKANLPAQE